MTDRLDEIQARLDAAWHRPGGIIVFQAHAPDDIRYLLADNKELREEMLSAAEAIHSARQDKDDTMGEFPDLWPLYAELEHRLREAALAAPPQECKQDG